MMDINVLKEEIRDKVNIKEEKILLFKILDKIDKANKENIVLSSNFLNLTQINLVKKYINYEYIFFYGGLNLNERNIAIISNKEITDINQIIEENLSYIKIEYSKFNRSNNISHRDILGTILSLGIERELIGDILINNESAYVICKKEISDLILNNIKKIRNVSVRLKKVNIGEVEEIVENVQIDRVLVASMRLDNILTGVLNISRSKAQEIIAEGRVFINWIQKMENDTIVKINDVISIRKIGRVILKNSVGISKRGKIILEIEKYM